MNKFNKFIILAGLLFSFSGAYAEIKEVESLDTISKQILGDNSAKAKKEKLNLKKKLLELKKMLLTIFRMKLQLEL